VSCDDSLVVCSDTAQNGSESGFLSDGGVLDRLMTPLDPKSPSLVQGSAAPSSF
jgi:hypothetical protein